MDYLGSPQMMLFWNMPCGQKGKITAGENGKDPDKNTWKCSFETPLGLERLLGGVHLQMCTSVIRGSVPQPNAITDCPLVHFFPPKFVNIQNRWT